MILQSTKQPKRFWEPELFKTVSGHENKGFEKSSRKIQKYTPKTTVV